MEPKGGDMFGEPWLAMGSGSVAIRRWSGRTQWNITLTHEGKLGMMRKVLNLDLLEVDGTPEMRFAFWGCWFVFFDNVDHQSIQSNGIFALSLLTCCLITVSGPTPFWRVLESVVLSATKIGEWPTALHLENCVSCAAIAGRCVAGFRPVPFEPAYVIHESMTGGERT